MVPWEVSSHALIDIFNNSAKYHSTDILIGTVRVIFTDGKDCSF